MGIGSTRLPLINHAVFAQLPNSPGYYNKTQRELLYHKKQK